MLPGKHLASHSGVLHVVVVLFMVVFAWQWSVGEAFSAAVTPPVKRYQICEELRINNHPVPTRLDFASIYFYEGLEYERLGRLPEAILAFKEAIVIRRDFEAAYLSLGTVYLKVRSWEEALASFEKVVEIDPSYAEAYVGIGMACTMLDRNNEAMKACLQAIRIRPGYGPAYYALALNYLMIGDRASALEQYEILKGINQNLADYLGELMNR